MSDGGGEEEGQMGQEGRDGLKDGLTRVKLAENVRSDTRAGRSNITPDDGANEVA